MDNELIALADAAATDPVAEKNLRDRFVEYGVDLIELGHGGDLAELIDGARKLATISSPS